jgi:hypothetical protein
MSQIGKIEIETENGKKDIPVFEPGDSGLNVIEPVRVKTDSSTGIGFLPLTEPIDAAYPFLRVQTSQGVFSITNTSGTPNSVNNQYKGRNFTTSTWTDSVGTADMSVNGVNVSSTTLNGSRAASSDGVDDIATANGPQDLPKQKTFGFSFTFRTTDTTDGTDWLGVSDSGGRFAVTDSNVRDGTNGELLVDITDSNDNSLFVQTASSFADGFGHLACINVNGDSASDIVIYIDDMSQSGGVATQIEVDDPFDNSLYNVSTDMGFFDRNSPSGASREKDLKSSFFEFNSEPYTRQERQELLKRAPGAP